MTMTLPLLRHENVVVVHNRVYTNIDIRHYTNLNSSTVVLMYDPLSPSDKASFTFNNELTIN